MNIQKSDGTTLSVTDNTLDSSQVSITLIGKNASNYSKDVNENFLHLLENFAHITQPANSIDGQLWFDTSNVDAPRLRVRYNGSYPPVAGVWQQPTAPNGENPYGAPMAGDIWVDTDKGQLYINVSGGESWTLVGPQFSSTIKTGSYPDQITDSFGTAHYVIKNYVDDKIIEIIAAEAFTPQQKIDGFTSLSPGVNLTSNDNAVLNGAAYTAKRLAVTIPYTEDVSANNFVRKDVDNTIVGTLTFENGLLVGAGQDATFTLRKNPSGNHDAEIINSYLSSKIKLIATDATGTPNTLINVDGAAKSVGIAIPGGGVASSGYTLDVGGASKIRGVLALTSTASNALTVSGSAHIANKLEAVGDVLFNTTSKLVGKVTVGTSTAVVSTIIEPATDAKYNLGTSSYRFNTVHAVSFSGNLTGTANKATALVTTSSWKVDGHVQSSPISYDGTNPTVIFNTVVDKTAVTAQTASTLTNATDWINFYNNTGSFTLIGVQSLGTPAVENLVKIERNQLIADLKASLMPAGSLVPYAGLVEPDGWLFCAGQTVARGDYPALFAVLKTRYNVPGDGGNDFRLPDLRGRIPVGFSDMPGDIVPVPAPGFSNINTPADVAQSGLATVGGLTSSTSVSTNASTATSIYMGFNYIIKAV